MDKQEIRDLITLHSEGFKSWGCLTGLVSLLAGGKIAGFVGIILAVPIAVIVQEVFDYLAERKDKKSALGI